MKFGIIRTKISAFLYHCFNIDGQKKDLQNNILFISITPVYYEGI